MVALQRASQHLRGARGAPVGQHHHRQRRQLPRRIREHLRQRAPDVLHMLRRGRALCVRVLADKRAGLD